MYIKDLKFSLWVDFIQRDFLDGEFVELIKEGIINGATSNPAIFKNAILNSQSYKEQLEKLQDFNPKQKYEAVAMFDIQKAADILKPLYDDGNDGYVSIEVDPFLCDDAKETIKEGKRLFENIGRDNVMIKIPATEAGYEAMSELVSLGIPINATLVFSKSQAISCAKAIESGLKKGGVDVDSVISVFVSRIDRAIDNELQKHGIDTALSGIYNSSDIYETIEQMGIKNLRVLFASTGVKDDSLKPYYYVDGLLAYNSVNTAPIDTIKAFCRLKNTEAKLPLNQALVKEHFKKIEDAGIDFDKLIENQIADGLRSFKEAFEDILESI